MLIFSSWLILLIIGAIPFICLPGFTDINLLAKFFFLAISTLLAFGMFLIGSEKIHFSKGSFSAVILVAALFLSGMLAIHSYDALLASALVLIGFIFAFLIAHFSIYFKSFQEKIINTVMISGVIAAALGLYQYSYFRVFGIQFQDYYRIKGMLLPYVLPSLPNMRVSGMFGQPNHFALFLLIVLLAFFYRDLFLRTKPSLRWGLYYLPAALVSLVFFLTQSRSGHLCLALTLVAIIYSLSKRPDVFHISARKKTLACWVLVLVFSFLLFKALMAWNWSFETSRGNVDLASSPAGEQHLVRQQGLSGHNTDSRLILWGSAALVFLDHPLFGIGLDNFKNVLAEYQVEAGPKLKLPFEALGYTRWAHNEFFQVLAEGGLLGFLPFMAVLWILFQGFWIDNTQRKEKNPRKIYLYLFLVPIIVQASVTWSLRNPVILVFFLTFLGLIWGKEPTREFALSRFGRLSFTALCFLSICFAGLLLTREAALARVQGKLAQGEFSDSLLIEFETAAANPYSEFSALNSALPRIIKRATLLDDNLLARRLLSHAEKGVKIEGAYWQWYNLSRLYHVVGKRDEAKEAVKRAINLKPDHEPAWVWQHYMHLEDKSSATGIPVQELIRQEIESWERLNDRNSN